MRSWRICRRFFFPLSFRVSSSSSSSKLSQITTPISLTNEAARLWFSDYVLDAALYTVFIFYIWLGLFYVVLFFHTLSFFVSLELSIFSLSLYVNKVNHIIKIETCYQKYHFLHYILFIVYFTVACFVNTLYCVPLFIVSNETMSI